MTQQAPALQVPVRVENDRDGVAMNICQFDTDYYARIRLQMMSGGAATSASNLPYLVVRNTPEAPDTWRVATQPHRNDGRTDREGRAHVRVAGPGRYRVFIKEPTEQFVSGNVFTIPRHALATGTDSDREVQPLVELEVIENANCTLSVRRTHPNGMQRTRGGGSDQIPADGAAHRFTQAHTSYVLVSALDLGNYVVSFQLWADASRTYGTNHPLIQNSTFRDALRIIYGEQLTAGTGAGASPHDRILTSGGREVQFNNQSTTGGRGRFSFREDNGQPGNRMTADETLRRTHPATMEFLLQMMDDLDITYARSTGAWRPHIGSTRHRYASAIDLTHVRTTVNGANNQQHTVTIQFHRVSSPDSNPTATGQQETAERTRMREFSRRIHVYIATARAQRTLGWLGGPWRLTYQQLGVINPNEPGAEAFTTNDTHVHHIHISMGIDQL
ncbi:hypothetical protein ACLB90_01065 [Stenotrophomonas sp. LGBM10]|uniref:hypothetical protein n=1 Tax=Stenotrophomonas sp. LGBM10 TaxID=3390038 RepID=UPI00398AD4B2